MIFYDMEIPGPIIIQPEGFTDERGSLFSSYNKASFEIEGIEGDFVQEFQSHSKQGVIRGLHSQLFQSKLVRVVDGRVYDVIVDIRRNSPTFGKWASTILSSENCRQIYIPEGFAHGFYVLTKYVTMLYKYDVYYDDDFVTTVLWNDPDIGIGWPIEDGITPIISEKDRNGLLLLQL